ncbi:MAG: hypothetical protein IIB56_18900 [Planctomycetes bacterium]|nr:hypothetical protein [Planctomycetota bacterium]MCH8118303.1 hypothetical protein [Planctomycetota bacterium]
MKKVIDINYLQKPVLEDYLAKNRDNYVVFTDFACMEIYKCNALKNLACKLKIVSQYPDQVIVLKGTREIVSLTLAPNKLPQSLIDNAQTIGFPEFCNQTKSACEGNNLLSKEVRLKESYASHYLEEQMISHQLIVNAIKGFAKSYGPSYLRALRTGKKLPPDMQEKITEHIYLITLNFFKGHPDVQAQPEFDSLKNSYVFRYSVSIYLLSLRWIKDGGIEQVSAKKLRNDAVDMSYVTYATYFDGLLSLDKKLNAIYRDTLNYLHYFNSPQLIQEIGPSFVP